MNIQETRLVVLALAGAMVTGLGAFGALDLLLANLGFRSLSPLRRAADRSAMAGLALLGGSLAYGYYLEADWLSETEVAIPTPHLHAGETLRVVLLSDLHVDGPSKALTELPDRVNALSPDLLVYTGDSLNSADGLPELHRVLSAIHPRFGRFAVRGNHDVWYWPDQDLFGGGVATELVGSPVEAANGTITLCGAAYGSEEQLARCLEQHREGLRLVAYHTPDEVEDLAPLAPDVYLAGHTHGGQIRLPFYGAVTTASRFDKKYEMGRYQVADTALFVTRGVGFEPYPAPRIRFLCRPEIAVIDLIGTGYP